MTRTILMMVKYRIPQISLVWVSILLTAPSRSENIPRITNLQCFNDLHQKILCSWDVVSSNSNCSDDFVLSYTAFDEKNGTCGDLRNEQLEDSVVPNKCICNITVQSLLAEENYEIKVQSHGKPVGDITVNIKSTIKPKAPINVQVEFPEGENGVVKWNPGYESSIKDKLSFQVQIICKHNRQVVQENEIKQTTPKYIFNKRQLKRGESYVVRVRTRHEEQSTGAWSEWSLEEEWKNDYSLTILDLMDVIIPVICIVMLCLLIGCYICFNRYKKTWWDTIPSPAKSTFVKKNLIQKHRTFPDRNKAAKKSCGSIFSRIVKAHKSKCDQLTRQDTARQYVISIVSSDCKKCIFEPKNEDVERCVEMYPIMEDESNPVEEDKPKHETEEDQPLEDLSIADMFFAILCDSPSIKADTFENFNGGLFGCPSLMDNFDKEEKHWFNLNDSGHQTLGYRNYDSDDSPLDSSSSIDVIKMPCFDQWLDNEIDCMPYTPKGSIKRNYSYQSKGDCLTSPGYNSFANALSDAKKDLIINTTKTFCLDSFSQSAVLGKANIYQMQPCPKSILYYNAKQICENSFQPNIQSKSGQIILQCQESKNQPKLKCQVSRYQSFDQAVQESELDPGCQMSGYKSFNQAVQQGDETSVTGYKSFNQALQQGDETSVSGYQSFDHAVQQGGKTYVPQLSGYKSFDQALQESEPESGCSMSGYKSFEKAIEEGATTSVCEVNGYQSFDQAVQESEPEFACTISGYKSFGQALEEGVDTSVCEVNGYQSFDQAIQESEPEFGCNISGYKSFDQAFEEGLAISVCEVNRYQSEIQESDSSGSNCFILDSGYKPFESLVCQNNDYSDKNGCKCKNDPCNNNNNKDFNSGEYKLISPGSMELKYSDCVKATMEKYPSFSDKPFKALKIAVGANLTNDMALKHEGMPLRLTFDIGEHLRNLENKHWHKVPLDNLEIGTIPFNHPIFSCHLDKGLLNQEQLITGKNCILHKCPLTTYTSEDMSFFKPLTDLDVLDSNETNKHLLIQQGSLDKDGNSYMKIK